MPTESPRARLVTALRKAGYVVELSRKRGDMVRVSGEVGVVLETREKFSSLIDASKTLELLGLDEHEKLAPIRYFLLSPRPHAALVIESVTRKTWSRSPQGHLLAPSCTGVEIDLSGRPRTPFRLEDLMRMRVPSYGRITPGEYKYLHGLETGAIARDHGRFAVLLRERLESASRGEG
jgi:hypothetical protein